ncbi:MAG: NUDIX domain-containing protein [Chloroflexi bacterium]|nr:NUDIX domain-containing protein [Chloroflexota bacterium]
MPRDLSKHWDVGVTGAVVHDGRVLYVQRNYEPNKGTWTLPGGYAEHNETLDEAIRREIREETGVEVAVRDVIGVRTRHDKFGAVLVIFRAALASGTPLADGHEIANARFMTADEISALEPVFALSRELGLRALRDDAHGLTETAVPPSSNERWKAFMI